MIPDPWWSESLSGWIGGAGGASVGVIGGIVGGLGGVLVPRGKGKTFIVGTMGLMVVFGALALLLAVAAVAMQQPYHVYYPLAMGGSVMVAVFGGLFPVILMNYRLAEARRLDGGAPQPVTSVPMNRSHHQMKAMIEMWGESGSYRRTVRPWGKGALVVGIAVTLIGVICLLIGKTFHVWFPAVMLGGESLIVAITLLAVTAAFGRTARSLKQAMEQQQLDAEALRRSG